MPYVQRTDGVIIGLYAQPQPDYAEEFIADDAPELVAYLTPSPLETAPDTLASIRADLVVLMERLARLEKKDETANAASMILPPPIRSDR